MTQMNEQDREYAIMEAHRIHDSDEYFEARPQIDSADRRRVFEAGFDRGYQAALQSPAVQVPDDLDHLLDESGFYFDSDTNGRQMIVLGVDEDWDKSVSRLIQLIRAASPQPVSQAGYDQEPVAWFAFCDSNGPVPLELWGMDEKACKHAVLENARSIGWKGTIEGYLLHAGWEIRPVWLNAKSHHPSAPVGEAVYLLRHVSNTNWRTVDEAEFNNFHGEKMKLFTHPSPTDGELGEVNYLSQYDEASLVSFYEQCQDPDADGYSVPKEDMKRLAEIGCVNNCGFGRYEVTSFGEHVVKKLFRQNPTFPLETTDDFNARQKALASREGK